MNDPAAPEPLRAYRRRAEALVRRARRLKARHDSSADPEIRDELERLEATRRDLWIDAGQAALGPGTAPAEGLSEGVAPAGPPAPGARPRWLRRALSAPDRPRLTWVGFLYVRIVIPLIAISLALAPLSWLQARAQTVDQRFVGSWTARWGVATFDLRADGTFSYRPAPGDDEPCDGRWWVSDIKNPKRYAIPSEPMMLHLRSDTDWRVVVEVMRIAHDELVTPLPNSITAMTRGHFPRFDPVSYRRTR